MRRMMRPTVVTRGSSFCAQTAPVSSLGIHAHGAEFVHGEQGAIEADARLAVKDCAGGGKADGEGGKQHDGGRQNNPHNGDGYVREALVEEVLRARSQLSGVDELGGANFFEADASADTFVGIGGFFDDVAGEAQLEQFADRHAVAPLEHADDDTVGLGSAHDLPEGRHAAEDFAAGEGGAEFVAVVEIAGDLQADFGVIGDVLADVFEQGAAAYQQQAIAAHHLKGESGKEDPPEEDGHYGERAAHHHDADGYAQAGVDVGDEALGKKGNAHYQAKLLDQDDPGFDVNVGIEIVKMQAH